MLASELEEHLNRSGVLARELDGEIQYLRLVNGRARLFGIGSATYKPDDVRALVQSRPEIWLKIDGDLSSQKSVAYAKRMFGKE